MEMTSESDIAWAAGFFEGEGCIYTKKNPVRKDGTRTYCPMIEIKSTDNDVLHKFQAIMGGTICGPYWAPRSTKPFWSWYLYNQRATPVIHLMYPYLGERRQQKAREVFSGETF